MSESTLDAQIAAAEAYESLFVPAPFGQWATRVADAAQAARAQHVLDVACGTGVLAREVAARTGPTGRVAGVDPNPGMFFADRGRAIGEMLRVSKPGGRLAVAVWDSLEHTPAYATEVALLERLAGRAAADALRAPFVLGDRGGLKSMFEEAGAGSVEVTTLSGKARFPSIRVMVEADLRGWLPVMGVFLDEELISRSLREAEEVLGGYVARDGHVEFDIPAHVVTAEIRSKRSAPVHD